MSKFNPGDRVRFIRDDAPFHKGDKATVLSYGNSAQIFPYTVRRDDGIENLCAEASLELLSPATPSCPFSVGDRVTPIGHRPVDADTSPTWVSKMDRHIGQIGIITGIYGTDKVTVKFSYGEVWNYKSSWLLHAGAAHEITVSAGSHKIEDAAPLISPLPLINPDLLLTDIKIN